MATTEMAECSVRRPGLRWRCEPLIISLMDVNVMS